jgi:PAS domain-containing protein
MILFLAEATAAAKADGFSALRVTGEMTWVLGGEPGTERLFEYEAKLNYFLPEHDALAICQYDRRRFAADVILDVIRTHPVVISGDLVCDNFHFVPPDDFLQPDQPAREVDRLLSSIIDVERARQTLEQASRHWSATFDAMNDMVCLLARDGTVLRCNQTMSNLLGLGADEVVGKKCYELMHGSSTFFEKCPYQVSTGTRSPPIRSSATPKRSSALCTSCAISRRSGAWRRSCVPVRHEPASGPASPRTPARP